VTFLDKKSKTEKNVAGQTVCFSVKPSTAGSFSPTCSVTNSKGIATSTFTASFVNCGTATIRAEEPSQGDTHHTKITIKC
jgi:hypothetical protein